jgi:hypothetical protein
MVDNSCYITPNSSGIFEDIIIEEKEDYNKRKSTKASISEYDYNEFRIGKLEPILDNHVKPRLALSHTLSKIK